MCLSYFVNGQETFGFDKKSEVLKWIDNINRLLTGEPGDIDLKERQAIPGTEFVAATVKDTIDTFKGVFGIKSGNTNTASIEKATIKCISCGAPVSGNAGSSVRCKYCDTDQNL